MTVLRHHTDQPGEIDLTLEHVFDYSEVMTAALDLAPDPGPLAAGVGEVNATLDRMFAGVDDDLAPSECAGLVGDLERIGRRFDALKLRLVARGETAAAARRDGFPDKAAWLARQTRQSGPAAARQARLADDLGTAPATGDALAEGALSAEHAGVITHALAQLPARVTAQQRARVEADLVAMAARFDPAQLRRAARRALASIEPDETVVDAAENEQVTTEEDTAYATSSFTFHVNDDATVTGHFTVPALQFSFLRKILEAMTAPRRNTTPGARAGSDPATDHRTDWSTRRGQAFAALLERLPTDHLHAKTAATVVVHLDLDTLRGHLKTARLDTDDQVSAGQARRLACSAGILPAVLGGKSLPLDLGRTRRLYSDTQRIALSIRHTHCAAADCQRPFAWCEIHHRKPWSHGGPTDLADAVPLCAWHHRRIHAM